MLKSMQQTRKSVRVTEQTLADQLQITDREIAYRKMLMDLGEDDVQELIATSEHVLANIDRIVGRFYDQQLAVSEIALLIGDAETLDRLRQSMRRYVFELFDGYYDGEYVNKRLRIGKIHKRIGVPPKLYIAAVCALEEEIMRVVAEDPAISNDLAAIARRHKALKKLMMFDVQLVFDTYISTLVAEVHVARDEIEAYAESLEDVIEQRTRQLRELSTRDALTGLHNHRAFIEHLRREVLVVDRTLESLALMYLDLNGFKRLNDRRGHRVGDEALMQVGKTLANTVRETDIACRYGGDEFCVIMPRTTVKEAEVACHRVITAFEQNLTSEVTVAIGVAIAYPQTAADYDILIRSADKMMFEAKKVCRTTGKSEYCVDSGEGKSGRLAGLPDLKSKKSPKPSKKTSADAAAQD